MNNEGVNSFYDLFMASTNDAIRTIIVLCILVIIVFPIYVRAVEKRRKQSNEQQGILIKTIAENSSVLSKLSTILENNTRACDSCKLEQTTLYHELSRDVKGIDDKVTELKWYMLGNLEAKISEGGEEH